MAVIYEVNLDIATELAPDFAEWLPHHVAEVLALPGFIDGIIAWVEKSTEGETAAFSVRYRLHDQQSLDDYLALHAARMRADGLARFGEHMRASRRILTEIQYLKAN